jgi:hypothetical protein
MALLELGDCEVLLLVVCREGVTELMSSVRLLPQVSESLGTPDSLVARLNLHSKSPTNAACHNYLPDDIDSVIQTWNMFLPIDQTSKSKDMERPGSDIGSFHANGSAMEVAPVAKGRSRKERSAYHGQPKSSPFSPKVWKLDLCP